MVIFNCYVLALSYASYIYQYRPGFPSCNLICKLKVLFLLCPMCMSVGNCPQVWYLCPQTCLMIPQRVGLPL